MHSGSSIAGMGGQAGAAEAAPIPIERRAGPGRRRRDLLELSVGYGLILLVLWTPPPWQRRLYLVAAAFLIAASIRPGEGWRGLGFSARNLLPSSLFALAALAVAGVSVAFAAHRGVLHAPMTLGNFFRRYAGYMLWSFAQQFLLQDFFLLRFCRLLPGRTALAVVAAAGIFAAAHLPSPILVLFTLIWGLIACAAFVRYRNLYPLSVAHAILGISVAICLPGPVTHNMRVGLGYLRYGHRYGHHLHRRMSDQTVSTRV